VSSRNQIKMDPTEVAAYLAEQRTIQVATIGPRGRPHLAPLWYAVAGTDGDRPVLVTWTYAKSQKAANLRRLPQATVLVESGATYTELRGVSMECDVEVTDDYSRVLEIGTALVDRYGPAYEADRATMLAAFEKQATKRVGLVLTATRVVTWDHSKMG